MRILSKKILFYLSALLIVSCGGGGDDSAGDDEPEVAVAIPDPSATSLVFPENNTECNEGVIVNDTQSTVTFRWEDSENTDSFEVNLRNLNTSNISRTSAVINEANITIDRGTPYEWFVISSAQGTNVTATSAVERFFNQGPGIENYAPFPAEVVSPQRGSSISAATTVTLEWTASDIDDDIVEFDVLFGTDTTPEIIIETTADTSLEANITSGQTYFWRVVSRDAAQNSSQSEIFEFIVN